MHNHGALTRHATTTVVFDVGSADGPVSQPVYITKITDLDELLEGIDPVVFNEDERLPYWAELWPSAVGLARYVARSASEDLDIEHQSVLELGCGLGLVGVVAALRGARVVCTDYETDALAFARHNAQLNQCQQMQFRLVDWRRPALRRRYATILASDVLYEARNFGPLVALLQRFLSRRGRALFADPGRVNGVPFFALLRHRGFEYDKVVEPVEWDGCHQIDIYSIRHRLA